jgi:hypothetical protein
MEMQEILAMKLRPGQIDAEKARLQRTRREVEALRLMEEVADTEPSKPFKLPMPVSKKQKLIWLSIVGPSAAKSLAMILGGIL